MIPAPEPHTSPTATIAGMLRARRHVEVAPNPGEFWKPCPGTTGDYLCCGLQILTPVTGCGMYCRYCVLQTYQGFEHQVVFENFEALEDELARGMAGRESTVRFCTGEFADSLYLEPRFGVSVRIAAALAPYPSATVEFKTKSVHVQPLERIQNRHQVVVGFSLNTPRMINTMEHGTAPLQKRLDAARWCEDKGFAVAFHCDPMFHYDGCEEEYRAVVSSAIGALRSPDTIAWWSLGGFRCAPALKRLLREKGLHVPLFSGELIPGSDRKYRYFRPLRVGMYNAMRDEADRCGRDVGMYLCMESRDVWRDCGLLDRIPNGLAAYLDERARRVLQR